MKFSNFLLMIVYSLAISGLVVFAYDKYKVQDQIPKFYMIDSQLIVEQKKNELKEMIFKQGQQPTEDAIIDYLTKIDKIVEYISKRDNAIIVVKTAVASKNVKDITREVLQIYTKEVSGKSIN